MSMLGIFFFITNSFACVTLALSSQPGSGLGQPPELQGWRIDQEGCWMVTPVGKGVQKASRQAALKEVRVKWHENE